jgi:hypothetical protein
MHVIIVGFSRKVLAAKFEIASHPERGKLFRILALHFAMRPGELHGKGAQRRYAVQCSIWLAGNYFGSGRTRFSDGYRECTPPDAALYADCARIAGSEP